MSEISKKRQGLAEINIRRLIPHIKKCDWKREYMEECDGFFELHLRNYKVTVEEGYFTVYDRNDYELFQLHNYDAADELFYELKHDEDFEAISILEEIAKEVEA